MVYLMNEQQSGIGYATGKIILMGEHSVIYGKPAIALPFQQVKIMAEISPNEQMLLNCSYYSGMLSSVPDQLKNIRKLVEKLLVFLHKTDHKFQITIKSTIPSERGMGSSAATAVALVRAFFDYFSYTPSSSEELLNLVSFSEKIAHCNPSGIDAAATSSVHPLYFMKEQPIQPIELKLTNAYLIVADTGIKGQTREAVKAVACLFDSKKQATMKKFQILGELTEQAKQAMTKNQASLLGKIMNQAQEVLKTLGVSNKPIDNLIEIAHNNGATGAKLTGSGRGGCVITLSNNEQTAEQIAKALLNAGAKKTWIQPLGVKQ